MNRLEQRLSILDPSLFEDFKKTKLEVDLLLQKYSVYFADYTDHSINHTMLVFKIASEILTDEEIHSLNSDELYVLSMACILHDVGMCIPEDKVQTILGSTELMLFKKSHPNKSTEDAVRDIHHTLSKRFINAEWEALKIPSQQYAHAIGLVAEGHRKVDLGNFEIYDPEYFSKMVEPRPVSHI